MVVYIVDDDKNKRDSIKNYLRNIDDTLEFKEFNCARNFLAFAKNEFSSFENRDGSNFRDNKLLILDMIFPWYENERPEVGMGFRVLTHIEHRKYNFSTIICSSDDVENSEYDILGTIKYNSSVYLQPFFDELFQKYLDNLKNS